MFPQSLHANVGTTSAHGPHRLPPKTLFNFLSMIIFVSYLTIFQALVETASLKYLRTNTFAMDENVWNCEILYNDEMAI
jgi:hypothetical protein